MMGKGPVLIALNDGKGVAIFGEKTYAVDGTYTSETWNIGGEFKMRFSVALTTRELLDENAQKEKITVLERQLSREREKLESIQDALRGDEESE